MALLMGVAEAREAEARGLESELKVAQIEKADLRTKLGAEQLKADHMREVHESARNEIMALKKELAKPAPPPLISKDALFQLRADFVERGEQLTLAHVQVREAASEAAVLAKAAKGAKASEEAAARLKAELQAALADKWRLTEAATAHEAEMGTQHGLVEALKARAGDWHLETATDDIGQRNPKVDDLQATVARATFGAYRIMRLVR